MSNACALAYRERLDALFGLYAEPLTIVRAGDNLSRLGLFEPMDNSTSSTFFDPNEQVGLQKPSQSLWMEATDNPTDVCSLNDVYFRSGRLWTVRKTQVYNVGDTALVLLALCD